MSHTKGWRVWVLWINAAFLLITVILYRHFTALPPTETLHDTIFDWIRRISAAGAYSIWSVGPIVLIASLLIYQRRLRWLVLGALAVGAGRIIVEILCQFDPDDIALRNLLNPSMYACVVASFILLIFFPLLRERHRWIQITTVAVLVLLYALQESRLPWLRITGLDVVNVVYLVLTLAALAGVSAVAYLAMLHQVPALHQPPDDAADHVALTCPRCGAAQTIPTNGGECAHCRLQIFIALDEGTCPNCKYLLRGLTSGVCPECGTRIAGAAAAAVTEPLVNSVETANSGGPPA